MSDCQNTHPREIIAVDDNDTDFTAVLNWFMNSGFEFRYDDLAINSECDG